MDPQALIADIMNNAAIWIPVAITIVSSVITAATKYNNSGSVVGILQRILGVLSLLEHFDAPPSTVALKLPFTPAALPTGAVDHVGAKLLRKAA